MNISIKEFVNLLSQKDLSYGHARGWLEDQDEMFGDKSLNRQTAARIIHQYMKIELGVSDLPDITPANILKDLYTCHTCVNHIAQIYLRGIMDAQIVERDGIEYKVFNHYEEITSEESKQILKNIKGCLTTPPFCA